MSTHCLDPFRAVARCASQLIARMEAHDRARFALMSEGQHQPQFMAAGGGKANLIGYLRPDGVKISVRDFDDLVAERARAMLPQRQRRVRSLQRVPA